ncbi:MAG: hypothetical protein ACR2PT_15855, partial [Endozoicomonas sp.]
MKICSKPSEIRGAINRIRPEQIAVGFLGAGWQKYINSGHLKEVVVSTMLGSNPRAIEELMNFLGHENVYFLDNLHSKIYLGETSAFLGSANLSHNGLSDDGHMELGIEVTDDDAVKKVRSTFRSYKKQAKASYPTESSKKKKLEKMYGQWQRAISSGVNLEPKDTDMTSIADYEPSLLDHIHTVWYTGEGGKYNQGVIQEQVPEALEIPPEHYFSSSTHFLEGDDIQEGHWILLWRCNDDGLPRRNGDISWIYVDKVVSNGVSGDGDYTKLAAQIRQSHRQSEPFLLNDVTKKAIRKVLKKERFASLRMNEDEAHCWSVEPAAAYRDEFL